MRAALLSAVIVLLWSPWLWAKATLANAGSDEVHLLEGQLSHMTIAAGALWGCAFGLWFRLRNEADVLQRRWKLTHVLPATLQLLIFATGACIGGPCRCLSLRSRCRCCGPTGSTPPFNWRAVAAGPSARGRSPSSCRAT